jgi:hypothetical protein
MRSLALVFILCFAYCQIASSQDDVPGPHNWHKIAGMPPGTPLEVRASLLIAPWSGSTTTRSPATFRTPPAQRNARFIAAQSSIPSIA